MKDQPGKGRSTAVARVLGKAVAAGLAFAACAATAAPIEINTYRNGAGDYTSGHQTNHAIFNDGVAALDVYGYYRDRSTNPDTIMQTHVWATGIGVNGGEPNAGLGVDHTGATADDDTNPGQIDNSNDYGEWLALEANSQILGVTLSLFGDNDLVRIIGSDCQNFLMGGSCRWTDLVTGPPAGFASVAGDSSTNPTTLMFDASAWNYVNVFVGEGGQFCGAGETCDDKLRLHSVLVPEPPVTAGLALGLISLVLMRRRKA